MSFVFLQKSVFLHKKAQKVYNKLKEKQGLKKGERERNHENKKDMSKSSGKKSATKALPQQEYVIQIPDGGYGWVVLIASFVSKIFTYLIIAYSTWMIFDHRL